MSYAEAMEATVSLGMAQLELELHGADWLEFTAEYGSCQEYAGSDVLAFLGY